MACRQVAPLTILLCLSFAGVSATEGACGINDLDFDVEADGCQGLSLMQRHARLTSKQHAKPVAELPGEKLAAFFEVAATDEPLDAAPAATAGKMVPAAAKPFSRPWKNGALFDTVGPVPLGLLAFSSEVHSTDKMKLAPNVRFLLLVFLPVAAIGLTCILFFLLSNQQTGDDDTRSSQDLKYSVASGQASPLMSGNLPGQAGALLTSQSSLTSSLTRQTQQPTSMAFSPITPSVRLPVQQMAKAPACLFFPTMAADVRRRNRSFDVYWGATEAPWFRLDCKPGAVDHDRLELYEVHHHVGERYCAGVDLNSAESTVVDPNGGQHWRITNQFLNANTRGLAYRSTKDNSKVRNAVASWGTTVPGVETGDGWLKVSDWYLPMKVNGFVTIVPAKITDVPKSSGLHITRADGMPFATFKSVAGGQWAVVRDGGSQTMYNISIGTNNFLLEATTPSGKRVAFVKRDQVNLHNHEICLELCVEPELDPVIMLIGCVAVLRQLPAHEEEAQ